MDPKAIELLGKERICVISVVMTDEAPHAAIVHYSHASEPVRIFIQTYPTVKTKAIQEKGGKAKAAVALGNEGDFIEVQMRGEVRIVIGQRELDEIYKIHYAKYPGAEKHKDAETIFLEFTPTWWRYTDFNTDPEIVVESK